MPNESELGLYLHTLMKRKLGDLLSWERPEVEKTVGPYDPRIFHEFSARRDIIVTQIRDHLNTLNEEDIELIYHTKKPDPTGKRMAWADFLESQFEALRRLMRPVKSMIEFKQIVGRGTRTFEGKDFFTVYDFVKAYEHFNGPEWDGEPLPPDEPRPKLTPSPTDNPRPGGPKEPGSEPEPKITIKLADGKERKIKYIAPTTYFSHDGKMISGQEFMDQLFGDLGDLVKGEDELRKIWSDPETRVQFLKVLADRGYDAGRLEDMKRLIDAPNSDVFDVLAYVKFTLAPQLRSQRAEAARQTGLTGFEGEMRSFLDSVLSAYEIHGVDELALTKIGDFLKVRYGGTNGAKRALGEMPKIKQAFTEIQTHLFAP